MTMTLSYHIASSAQRPQYKPIPLLGTDCVIRSNVPLAPLTSFRVGGPAEWYVTPKKLDQLQASFQFAHSEGLPITLLGGGSNMLVSDSGLPGLVISSRNLRHINFEQETGLLTVGAGESLPRIAWKAARMGWQGLEWVVGIPGTVGGAVVMNAGAQGKCIADILVNAHAMLPDGRIEILSPQDLEYSYRHSSLQGKSILVAQATFQLQPGENSALVTAITSENFNKRKTSQPYHLPSCGSVFRNPGPKAAGWLIEQTGLKGYQIGMAQVAHRHANFILNCGGATANDIFQLIYHVQEQVEKQWSFLLKPEVKMIGDFSGAATF
ncbi:UDP-N-acetylmuramate dehydrogenase [Okeania sp. SIO2B3]|uniref:UDP-N-acetylmuramate dehydrogenase n=1 Tax=Okeania sp. SIO2B3 TaxID=2607784 RepID=UPI0013BF7C1B|nr:UDP-N-acetylmuramate dehydrogenase [Okeania sp. SIO2B3]